MTEMREIARFSALSEASIAMSFLQANGIDAVLADFNLHSILPISLGRAGVRLMAPANQSHMATILLAQVSNQEHRDDADPPL